MVIPIPIRPIPKGLPDYVYIIILVLILFVILYAIWAFYDMYQWDLKVDNKHNQKYFEFKQKVKNKLKHLFNRS